ncbi:MAG: formate dehydrogenase subunit alpha [Dehalococcoidia bacterium]
MGKITLTIDGKEVKVREAATVLEAAKEAEIYIPTLCYHPGLPPFGACRLCIVEIEKMRGFPSSCTTPATNDMVVHTNTPRIQELRHGILELILSEHPYFCAICERRQRCESFSPGIQKTGVVAGCHTCPGNGKCELEEVIEHVGLKEMSLTYYPRELPILKDSPFIDRDYNLCILCGRCVRVCHESIGVSALAFTYRGPKALVGTAFGRSLQDSGCQFCGACVDACPTGSLIERAARWEGVPDQLILTTCPYCGIGCQLNLEVKDGNVATSVPSEGGVNHGLACVKGRFAIRESTYHPSRLKSPLIKRDGRLETATWEEAVNLIASKLPNYQGEQFALICSSPCTNEDYYIAQKFARVVMNSNNIDQQSSRLSHSPSVIGLSQSFGSPGMTNSINEIGDAACILLIGSNVSCDNPIIRAEIMRAVDKGAKLIVVNPQRIDLCRFAHSWLQLLPGSDVALLMGMMRVIVDENLADWPFIEERCENFDAFKESLKEFTPDFVEKVTGLAWQQVVETARTYAKQKPAVILYGTGITQHTHGTNNVLALCDLAMLTGNLGKPSSGVYPLEGENNAHGACDMGAIADFYPDYQPVYIEASKANFERAWACALNSNSGLTFSEIFNAVAEHQIKALYLIGNPIFNQPLPDKLRHWLEELEILIVQDSFPSEISQLAHVVLPAASFAEKDGTFTSAERKVQRVRKASKTIGNSKPDWQIICQVAEKMGAKGFHFDHPSQIMEEIATVMPDYSGITYERLEGSGLQWPCPGDDHRGTPILYSDKFANGKGRFTALKYKPSAELPDENYPLILTTECSLYHLYTKVLTSKVRGLEVLSPKETVEMNPLDAAKLGINDGDVVKVISRRGELTSRAKVTEAVASAVVSMNLHLAESLINSAVDFTSRIPEFKVCAVKIEKT